MPTMTVEKFQALDNPRVETARKVATHLPSDMFPITKPLQLVARSRRPNRFLAFLAVVAETHTHGLR
jgi:hypothetical protein